MTVNIISVRGNRRINQDSLLAFGEIYEKEEFLFRTLKVKKERPVLFAVADGMGGEQFGEMASETVLQILKDEVEPILETTDNLDMCAQAVTGAIQKAQTVIENELKRQNSTGGTTVSVLLMYKKEFIALNIGDSPICLVRKRKLTKLSKEHTLACMKLKKGIHKRYIPKSDYHCLVQSVGSGGYDEINFVKGQCFCGDTLAVMSDGMVLGGYSKVKKFLYGYKEIAYTETMKNAMDNASAIVIRI